MTTVSALQNAARGYCHEACIRPTGPHDDGCAWFGTRAAVPTQLPRLLPPEVRISPLRSPCCLHGNGEDADCCICCDNPCDGVTVELAIRHGQHEADRLRKGWEREVAYVLEHGKVEEPPF